MDKVKNILMACLFCGAVAFAGLGVLPTAAQSAVPLICASYGCVGGPDNCVRITIKYNGGYISVMCYTTVVKPKV